MIQAAMTGMHSRGQRDAITQSATAAEHAEAIESMNRELHSLQNAMLSLPRSQRTSTKIRVAELDSWINARKILYEEACELEETARLAELRRRKAAADRIQGGISGRDARWRLRELEQEEILRMDAAAKVNKCASP